MVGNMDVDVVAQHLNPLGIIAVEGAAQLSFYFVPGGSGAKLNFGDSVVYQGKVLIQKW